MRRLAAVITFLLLCLALPAVAADLRRWTPPDSQLTLEITDLGAFRAGLREVGLDTVLTERMRKWTPASEGFAAGDPWANLPDLTGISVLLAASGFRADVPAGPMRGLLAVGFPTADSYEAFSRQTIPAEQTGWTVTATGPFRIYTRRPEGAAGRSPDIACGENTVLLGWGVDLSRVVAEYLAGARPPAPAETDPLLSVGRWAAPRARLHLDLAAMGLLSDAAVSRFVHAVKTAPEPPAGRKGEMALLRSFLDRMPEDKLNEFVKGLGLGTIRTLDAAWYRDGERCLSSVTVGLGSGAGVLPELLDSLRSRRLQVMSHLPADTVMASDFLGDPAGLFRRLREHAVRTMGPQGETAFLTLELAAQVKLGLSLYDQILPTLGTEWGAALVPPSVGAPPEPVFFCVPEKPDLVSAILQKLQENGRLQVQPEPGTAGGSYRIARVQAGDAAPAWHLRIQDGVVFLTPRRETLTRILSPAEGTPRMTLAPVPPAAPDGVLPVVLNYTTGLAALPALLEPLRRRADSLKRDTLPPAASPAFHETLLTGSALVFHTEMPWPVLRALAAAAFEGIREMHPATSQDAAASPTPTGGGN
jgi:hypothetical protein